MASIIFVIFLASSNPLAFICMPNIPHWNRKVKPGLTIELAILGNVRRQEHYYREVADFSDLLSSSLLNAAYQCGIVPGMKDDTVELGDRIKQFRMRKGMTQKELAEAVGLNQVYISRIETGRQKTLRPSVLKALSLTLDVPIPIILGESGPVLDGKTSLSQIREMISLISDLDENQLETVVNFATFLKEGSRSDVSANVDHEKPEQS